MSSGGGSIKVIVVALCANLGIAVAKFAGAFFTGSAALLAEAIHSVVDCGNQVLLIVGEKAAKKPPTESHPLGFGRESFFWSFVVTVLLFTMGGMFAIYEGIHKLSHPEAMSNPEIALGILVVSMMLEGYSLYVCLKEINEENPYGSLGKWYRKSTQAGLLVIFTEDAGAMAGLTMAAVCVTLAWWTGNPVWDAVGSILIGLLLVVLAVILAREIKSLIVGEAPSQNYRPSVETIVLQTIPGAQILNFVALQTGDHEVMISMKITPGSLDKTNELVDAINRVERDVKDQHPEVKWSFIEPDKVD